MHADAAFGRLCSAEAVDTSSWPPAVGGNSHQPWVMSPAGAPAVGSLATERFAAKCSKIFGLCSPYMYIVHSNVASFIKCRGT